MTVSSIRSRSERRSRRWSAPAFCHIPTNNFSARWTLTANFTAGPHTFTVGSDDGHRLYIDGTRVLDTWRDQAYATRTTTQNLTDEKSTEMGADPATIAWT